MLEVVVAREPMRHRGLIAAGQPRQHPRGCVGTRRASRVLQRPAAASTAPGHSGYMDTPAGALCCDLSYVAKLSQPLGKSHGSEQLHNINESGMVVSLFTMRAHRWDTSPSRRPIATPSVDLEMKAKALQTCAVSGSDPLPEHTPNWHANSELPVSRGPVVLRIMWRTSPPSPAPMGDFIEFAT